MSTNSDDRPAAAPQNKAAAARVDSLAAVKRRVVLKGTLTADTAVRVGHQRSFSATGSDLPVVRDGNGMPFIPGSSLKGVLRSGLEAMIRGLGSGPAGLWSCDPLDAPCCKAGDNDDDEQQRAGEDAQELLEKVLRTSCDVCLLFGSPSMAGRLLFSDAVLAGDHRLPPVEVRHHVALDRDLETAKDGLKFDHEVVPAGTAFTVELVLENPAPYQVGLLSAAVDGLNDHHIQLGGGRTRGLGRVALKLETAQEWSAMQLLRLAQNPAEVPWDTYKEAGVTALADLVQRSLDHV